MQVTFRALSLPKLGSSAGEYEDAWACHAEPSGPRQLSRCALADGASESSFARLWANILVRAFARGEWDAEPGGQRGLDALRGRWRRIVSRRPLPWHAAEKVGQGAYATFLGLELEALRGPAARWRAVALGDSCLFQLRSGEVVRAFPFASRAALPLRPRALCSRPGDTGALPLAWGEARAGDVFLLMTDALAHWSLGELADGGQPWRCLLRLTDLGPGEFARWVSARRSAGDLRNDDVTLLSLSLREV